jgi:hypothetical protein
MKKLFLVSTMFISLTIAYSQTTVPDTTKKEFKNVISIEATGILRQFINQPNYNSPYMIGYKRIFKSNALRIGLGITSYKTIINDAMSIQSKYNNFYLGIGFEHYSYLTKRWNLYIGADAIISYRKSSSLISFSSTSNQTYTTYGISPLLGLQFKINSRLSVSTETSYAILYTISDNSNLYSYISYRTIVTNFRPPVAVNFRILF